MEGPGPPPRRPSLFAWLVLGAGILLGFTAVAFYGRGLFRRMMLDSADPTRQRDAMLEATGSADAPEGWRVARALDLPGKKVLLFEGTGGRPPVSLVAYTRDDLGRAAAEAWIGGEPAPEPGPAFGLRNARRLSRGVVETAGGPVPYAILEGADDSGLHRRGIFDLRRASLRHPSELQVIAKPGAAVDLEAAAFFVRRILEGTPLPRPSPR
ncbi:MAG TPA: hypothetical protein VFI25_01495 [Planctomycetota bacterium]|jgi:hypothetical protein|nr:hypothetical protein [Planctomycetota bacterium]